VSNTVKRVLLTGGTGMIGANLAHRLVADNYKVNILTRPESQRHRLHAIREKLNFIEAELTDATAVKEVIERVSPATIYHLASTPFNPPTISPQEHLRVIVSGTLNVLEAARQIPDAVVVFAGSAAVYGSGSNLSENLPLRPATVLGACKASAALLMQTYARLYGTRTVELRHFTPYGPWEQSQRLVPHAILAALDGKDLPMSLGRQQRDFVFIDDVVEALVLAGTTRQEPGSVFNIASGVGTPIKDVVSLILNLCGSPARALIGALPTRPDEIMEMSGNIDLARAKLGWWPTTSLEDGLRKTIAWLKAQREQQKDNAQ
jgi:nucleoside-diphosphate-sugar epimerase